MLVELLARCGRDPRRSAGRCRTHRRRRSRRVREWHAARAPSSCVPRAASSAPTGGPPPRRGPVRARAEAAAGGGRHGRGPGDVELAPRRARSPARPRGLPARGRARAVRIEARTRAGVFYGTRTRAPAAARRSRPHPARAARARLAALPASAGLMLDNGRRYFTPAWIKRRDPRCSPTSSSTSSTCTSPTTRAFGSRATATRRSCRARHLTKRQVRDAHRVRAALPRAGHPRARHARPPAPPRSRAHPELQAARPTRRCSTSSHPAARRFARDLILEYLELFGGRCWHAGADEYGAAGDFVGFVNWIDSLVRAHGRTLRVWHDGLTGVRLRPTWWSSGGPTTPARARARCSPRAIAC